MQSQELLVIAPAMLKCIALGSITLWKENKKSIFRALKAFLFFCGDQGGWEREDVWMLLAFLCVQDFFCFFCFPSLFCFFPLIGCTDLAQEIFSLMLLPMLSQSDSHLQQNGGTRHDR